MPLKGQAKKDYQREYMRRRRGSNKKGLTSPNGSNEAKQEKLAMLREIIANPDALQSTRSPLKEESNTRLPRYNKAIHKAGDRVLMTSPTGKLIEVVVPELDGDGNQIW